MPNYLRQRHPEILRLIAVQNRDLVIADLLSMATGQLRAAMNLDEGKIFLRPAERKQVYFLVRYARAQMVDGDNKVDSEAAVAIAHAMGKSYYTIKRSYFKYAPQQQQQQQQQPNHHHHHHHHQQQPVEPRGFPLDCFRF